MIMTLNKTMNELNKIPCLEDYEFCVVTMNPRQNFLYDCKSYAFGKSTFLIRGVDEYKFIDLENYFVSMSRKTNGLITYDSDGFIKFGSSVGSTRTLKKNLFNYYNDSKFFAFVYFYDRDSWYWGTHESKELRFLL